MVTHDEVKTKWALPISRFEKSISCFAICGTTVIAASGEGALFSIDGGDSWADLPAGSTYSNIESLEPGGAYLFAGTSFSGVWRLPLTQVPKGKK